MSLSPEKDRRRTSRQPCPHAYLRVSGRDVSLVDWSFGGLGLRFDHPETMKVSDEIEVDIFDPVGGGWETLGVVVRRLEADGIVGVEFKAGDPNVESAVIRLLHTSLADVKNPASVPSSAAVAASDDGSAGFRRPRLAPAEAGRPGGDLSDILLSEFE